MGPLRDDLHTGTGIAASGVAVSPDALALKVGGSTATLTTTVSPSDTGVQTVTWNSSAPTVASVSSDGLVTPLEAGRASITAKTDDGGFTASCSGAASNMRAPIMSIARPPPPARIRSSAPFRPVPVRDLGLSPSTTDWYEIAATLGAITGPTCAPFSGRTNAPSGLAVLTGRAIEDGTYTDGTSTFVFSGSSCTGTTLDQAAPATIPGTWSFDSSTGLFSLVTSDSSIRET
jgi:hypothetical protein